MPSLPPSRADFPSLSLPRGPLLMALWAFSLGSLVGCGESTHPGGGQAVDGGASAGANATVEGDGSPGMPGPGAAAGDDEVGSDSPGGDSPGEASTGEAAETGKAEVIDIEALAEHMLDVPESLKVTVDETLREDGDPKEYPLASTVGGAPVTLLRDLHPSSGILLRIYAVRTDSIGSSSVPVLHGPAWSYFDTAALSSVQWWKDNVAHGPAQHWRRVGTRKSEGRFYEGERDGLRREYAKNGKLLSQGAYRRGVAIGLHEEWFPSGQKMRAETFVNGRLEGLRRVWDRDGLLVLFENYVAGELHGRWSDFHPGDGDPREWGSYEAGQRVGIWQRGSMEGVVLDSTPYEADRKHGVAEIRNDAGQLIEQVSYVRGVKTGPRKTWYDDGTPQSEGTLDEGLRVGDWKYWKADGAVNKLWSGEYEGDQRIAPAGGD